MTDLVKRLRARLKHLRLGEAPAENLMDEAADEIERLRRLVEQLEFIIADMERRRP